MSSTDVSKSLSVLMIGKVKKLQPISDRLKVHPNVAVVAEADSAEYAYGIIRRLLGEGVRINTVFLDPLADSYDPYKSSLFILETRAEHPEIVFVLLVSDAEFRSRQHDFLPEIRSRLDHYYRVDPTTVRDQLNTKVDEAIANCLAWHLNSDQTLSHRRYEYDVAISFSGEDRDFAQNLAAVLKSRGVRVFYDDYMRPSLWGKNLYTTLYDIYAKKCRFCIILVSRAYKDKMWTNHERVAAQARALEMREDEYILPILLEDVTIPGLPPTVAYVSAQLGIDEIANLFVRKLALIS
jgi:hypothetical protein